jgi:hypothetical protein
MKIALYIADGIEQIILTPQDAAEATILEKLSREALTLEIFKGQFYQGRDRAWHSAVPGFSPQVRDSTYLFLRKAAPEGASEEPA